MFEFMHPWLLLLGLALPLLLLRDRLGDRARVPEVKCGLN